jgi:hypothetical protein
MSKEDCQLVRKDMDVNEHDTIQMYTYAKANFKILIYRKLVDNVTWERRIWEQNNLFPMQYVIVSH